MERLTSNKLASDMNVLELAYNSCYADKNHNARYRDYELDIDSRELIKNLAKDMCDEFLFDMSDEEFDEYMAEMLSVEMDSQIGLLALFYRNLWAMADLREKLKDYEDLEEQGRLLKLPCKVGDTIYAVGEIVKEYKVISVGYPSNKATNRSKFCIETLPVNGSRVVVAFYDKEFGKNVFLTKSEAEEKLEELRGGE
nr:MAG TPA: hypothetical protein [Bacteriophage sp.]